VQVKLDHLHGLKISKCYLQIPTEKLMNTKTSVFDKKMPSFFSGSSCFSCFTTSGFFSLTTSGFSSSTSCFTIGLIGFAGAALPGAAVGAVGLAAAAAGAGDA